MLSLKKIRQLLRSDPIQQLDKTKNLLKNSDIVVEYQQQFAAYRVEHTVEGGIERFHYIPNHIKYKRVILLQHGMWHGAWCWRYWQQWLAEQGWQSVSYSLPGHSNSPEQTKVEECTLGYYLFFLKQEIDRLEQPPIVIGHSMGGALCQWYLKYVGELPAVVFLASWTSHNILKDTLLNAMKIDPFGALLAPFVGEKAQFRRADLVKKWFLSDDSAMSPEVVKDMLSKESEVVLMQHRPPHWQPPTQSSTPKLWMAAKNDAIIDNSDAQRSAHFYQADYRLVSESNHDIMLEKNWQHSITQIHQWLLQKNLHHL